MGCPVSGRHLIRSMILILIRRCLVISALNRSSSRRAGKWLKRRRNAVSRNVLFQASSSMRMPRYSTPPPCPSTSLIRERAAGTPAKPGMKSCGIEKSIPWTPLPPPPREDLELLASGAAGGFLLLLHLLLRQREGSPARLAGADLEHRPAVFKAGRQEQVDRVVPQHDSVGELHDRRPDVELLPGGRLSLPGQRMVRADIDRLPVLAVAELPEVTGVGGGHRKIAGLLKRPLFGTRHGAIYTIRFRRGSSRPRWDRHRHRLSLARGAVAGFRHRHRAEAVLSGHRYGGSG